MPVRVVPILDDLRWEPNAPSARFVVTDDGMALLTLRPHIDDSDRRTVVIFWTGVSRASFGGPDDEGRDQHALYSYGLADLLWAGEVIGDDPVGASRHFVVPTKEAIAEVHAHTIHVTRMRPPKSIEDILRLARSYVSGVAWPDRRSDVIEALRRLTTISSANLDEWPDLTNVVHWLVDDTFWDHHSPRQEIGLLLRDDAEVAAIEAVLRPLLRVLDALGPDCADSCYLDHADWPSVATAAANAFSHLNAERR